MSSKVLFVDDEPNVLQSYQRNLRKILQLEVACGGEEALERMSSEEPFAVVVSDMRMPGMNGLELLSEVKTRSPDTVRIMLTGNNDQQTAVDAVNKGDVFRFLNKPCSTENLVQAVNAAFEHHKLVTMERKLLEETLHGTIRALAQVLALVNPDAFGRTERLERLMRKIGKDIGYPELWELETLALLSHIGCVVLPDGAIKKVAADLPLSEEESQLYLMHPSIGSDLISKIPRMEKIAESIMYQEKNYDGTGFPAGIVKAKEIPLGARILRVVLNYDKCLVDDTTPGQAIEELRKHKERYDPDILRVLDTVIESEEEKNTSIVHITSLKEGMVFATDIYTVNGALILCKGQEVTPSLRRRLSILHQNESLGGSSNVQVYDEITA